MDIAAKGEPAHCSFCQATLADFRATGRLGCAECYTTFAEGLESLLRTMHKGTKHMGKVPHSFQQSRDLADKLKSLQKKLEKAVTDEDFEQAAAMRDEIKTTKDKLAALSPS